MPDVDLPDLARLLDDVEVGLVAGANVAPTARLDARRAPL
jgi:hypothetical protein